MKMSGVSVPSVRPTSHQELIIAGSYDTDITIHIPSDPKKLHELDRTYFLEEKCYGDKQGISMWLKGSSIF